MTGCAAGAVAVSVPLPDWYEAWQPRGATEVLHLQIERVGREFNYDILEQCWKVVDTFRGDDDREWVAGHLVTPLHLQALGMDIEEYAERFITVPRYFSGVNA